MVEPTVNRDAEPEIAVKSDQPDSAMELGISAQIPDNWQRGNENGLPGKPGSPENNLLSVSLSDYGRNGVNPGFGHSGSAAPRML
jgi:hypothetical protein